MIGIYNKNNYSTSSTNTGYLTQYQADNLYLNKLNGGIELGALTVMQNLTAGSDMNVSGGLSVLGNSVIGDNVNDTLSIIGKTTFTQIPNLVNSNTETYGNNDGLKLATKNYVDNISKISKSSYSLQMDTNNGLQNIYTDISGNIKTTFQVDKTNSNFNNNLTINSNDTPSISQNPNPQFKLYNSVNNSMFQYCSNSYQGNWNPIVGNNENSLSFYKNSTSDTSGNTLNICPWSAIKSGIKLGNGNTKIYANNNILEMDKINGMTYNIIDGSGNIINNFQINNNTTTLNNNNLLINNNQTFDPSNPTPLFKINSNNSIFQYNSNSNPNNYNSMVGTGEQSLVFGANTGDNVLNIVPWNTTKGGIKLSNNSIKLYADNKLFQMDKTSGLSYGIIDGSGNIVNNYFSFDGSGNPIISNYNNITQNNQLSSKYYVDSAISKVNTSSQTMSFHLQTTTQAISNFYILTPPDLGSSTVANSTGTYFSVYLNTNMPISSGSGNQNLLIEIYWYYQNGANLQTTAIKGYDPNNPSSNSIQANTKSVVKRATAFNSSEICTTGNGKNSYSSIIINNNANQLNAYQLTASTSIWTNNAPIAFGNTITITNLGQTLIMSYNPIRITNISVSNGQKIKVDFGYPNQLNSPGYYSGWINSLGYYINIKSNFDPTGINGWYLSSS